jgi:hypothetical protein
MPTKPPKKTQKYPAGCWAACMESLGEVSAYLDKHSQDWYVTQWGPGPPTGGLDYNTQAFDDFRNAFGFLKVVRPAGQVSKDDVLNWLRTDSFLLVEQQGGGCSHARLAYNLGDDDGIKVMDPAPNVGGYKTIFPVDLDQIFALYW